MPLCIMDFNNLLQIKITLIQMLDDLEMNFKNVKPQSPHSLKIHILLY